MTIFTITRTDAVRRRADGSVAHFTGSVEIEGRAIDGFQIQTKASDVGADEIRIVGDQLHMPDGIATECRRAAAVQEERAANFRARCEADERQKHGHILDRLLPLEAVSDAQRELAEKRRRSTIVQLSAHLHDAGAASPDQARMMALFWDEVASETRARFWLDHQSVFGSPGVMDLFVDRVRVSHASAMEAA